MTSVRATVSVLCATHNRAPFIPWLEWNWARQEYPFRELILVDSSDDLAAVREVKQGLATRHDVLYVRASKNSIAAKLQLALEMASGSHVMIWCDDDWQHPRRIWHSVEAAVNLDADVVGWEEGHFLNLETRLVSDYRAKGIVTSAVAALVRTPIGRLVPFPDRIAEDTAWITQVVKRAQRAHSLAYFPHSLWLVHDRNTMARRRYRWRLPLAESIDLGEHLGDTVAQLDALQARLRKDCAA